MLFFFSLHIFLSCDFSKCKPEGYVIAKLRGLSALWNKQCDKPRYLNCKRCGWEGRLPIRLPDWRLHWPLPPPPHPHIWESCSIHSSHVLSAPKLPPMGLREELGELWFIDAVSMKRVSSFHYGSGSPSSHQTPGPCPSDSHY